MVLTENKKYIALAAVSLAVCAAANGAGLDGLEQSDYAILRGKHAGLVIVASWQNNVARFRSERAPYPIY